MEPNILYYLFSTIAQTYGAILGVIGMLTVYRLQRLNDYIKNTMEKYGTSIYEVFNRNLIAGELEAKWQDEKIKTNLPDDQSNWRNHFKDVESAKESIKKFYRVIDGTKDRFIWFLIFNVLIIFLSLILLPFTELLAKSLATSIFFILIMMLLIVLTLIATYRLCMLLIECDFKDFWKRTRINIDEHLDKYEKQLARYL